jgi:hypothetical protein
MRHGLEARFAKDIFRRFVIVNAIPHPWVLHLSLSPHISAAPLLSFRDLDRQQWGEAV